MEVLFMMISMAMVSVIQEKYVCLYRQKLLILKQIIVDTNGRLKNICRTEKYKAKELE